MLTSAVRQIANSATDKLQTIMILSKLHSGTFKSGTLLILAVGFSGCSQKSTPDKALSHAEPPVTVIVAQPKPTSTPVSSAPRQLTIFLPGQDGKLHEAQLKEPSDLAKKQLWEPESALALLFRKAPQFIPANTRLTDSIRKNKEYHNPDEPEIYTVFEVRLSKEFSSPQFWRDDKKARLAFDAIVKTTGNGIYESIHPTYPFHIYVLVEGKPIKNLGKVKIKNPAETY